MSEQQKMGTIIVGDGLHVQYVRGYSRGQSKEDRENGIPSIDIFETKSEFIYRSGKKVDRRADLEWMPEPYRTKALTWFDTGKMAVEEEKLSEIDILKRKIAELEGKQMGETTAGGSENPVPEKKEEKPKEEKPKEKKKVKIKGRAKPNISQAERDRRSQRMKDMLAKKKANTPLAA